MKQLRKNDKKPFGTRLSVGTKKMPDVDTSGRFKTKNKKHDTKIIKKRNMEIFEKSRMYVEEC